MRSASMAVLLCCLASPALLAQASDNHAAISAAGDQTEPSVAVDPNDANHLLVGAIDVPTLRCRFASSLDGGVTWQTGLLPNGARSSCTDPSVAFDRSGRAYFAGLFYDDGYSVTQIGVAVSTDGGGTFGVPVMVTSSGFVDKPYVAVDNSGGASDGRVYVAWNTAQPTLQCQGPDANGLYQNCPTRTVRLAWSNDRGVTYQPSLTVSSLYSNNFAALPAVGPDGEVYVGWRQFYRLVTGGWLADDAIVVAHSATGTSGYTIASVASLGAQAGGVQGTLRTTRYPVVAVSPGGATRGNVYVVYADDPPEVESISSASGVGVFVEGENSAGLLVGYERFGSDAFAGFLRERNDRRPINVTGATWTMPHGINDRNWIVGTYRVGTTGPFRGFMLDGNGFSTTAGQLPSLPLDVPGAQSTSPAGVNNARVIVGSYQDATGVQHGFSYDGAYRTIDVPGAVWTQAFAVNSARVVTGAYQDAVGVHGFTYDGAAFTTLDYPGATETRGLGINSAGRIVGAYRDGAGKAWAFQYDGTSYSTVSIPDAATSTATAIDDAGVIVGHYRTTAGEEYGFVRYGPPSQDVWLSRSGDGGATWAPAIRVNDVLRGDQFDAWMCVDRRGFIHVSWLDRRGDPANFLYRTYYARSVDGGLTVQPNQLLATGESDPRAASMRQGGAGFIGDYIGLGCGDGVAHAVWPDLRLGAQQQDIYHSAVACALTDNGDGTVTDGCTRLMWGKQADLALTQAADQDGNGQYQWPEAVAWADALVLAGYKDWRLPTARYPDFNCRPGATNLVATHCAGNEASNLYYARGVTLSQPAPFSGIIYGYYWTGTQFNPTRSFAASFAHGEMGSANALPSIQGPAWAVRDVQRSDTPTGTNARVEPYPGVSVVFGSVSVGGATTVTVSKSDPGLGAANFELLGTYYDVTTEAVASGSITVCVHYDEADLGGRDESTLQLAHQEGGVLVPVASTVDTDANVVCATVSSLSWFALGWRAGWHPSLVALGIAGAALLLVLGLLLHRARSRRGAED